MKPGTVAALTAYLIAALTVAASGIAQTDPGLIRSDLGKLPLYFVENRGLYPDEVAYFIQGGDKTLFFTKGGVTFALHGKRSGWVVKLDFVGTAGANPRGEVSQTAVFSYFRGREKDWKTDLPTFGSVVYPDLWPGIDLVYRGTVNRLKYKFVVSPGADPERIRLRYRGADRVEMTAEGTLRVETPSGSFEDARPFAYQEKDGRRVPVEMTYALTGDPGGNDGAYGFQVGEFDRTRPLVLDPALLVYCGYLGGSAFDGAFAVTVDGPGNMYVTGGTRSTTPSFPAVVGPDLTHNGNGDAFVAKVNPAGTALVFCGYLGGTRDDWAEGIGVDAQGNVYVAGYTESDETTGKFPVKVGPDLTYNGPSASAGGDAFVAKINALGTAILYCGYVGGGGDDWATDLALDAGGSVYVSGLTDSPEASFPVMVGPDLTFNDTTNNYDGFVAKVNPAGSALTYCGYIGGADDDGAWGVAVDAAGGAYVVGDTSSPPSSFPVAVGPDLTYNGAGDVFVAKVNASGKVLDYCGYIGGAKWDESGDIAVDASGNAYVAGVTHSDEKTFPVAVGPDLTFNSPPTVGADAFVTKVDAKGSALVYCGYIGGYNSDESWGIALDGRNNAYVVGETSSNALTFPVAVGPDLTYNGGPRDGFVARVDSQGASLDYCGYLGGVGDDGGWSVAADRAGNAFVIGQTQSTEATFPVAVGPDLTYNQGGDAFLAKVSLVSISGSGAPRPGTTVTFRLTATDDRGLAYQVGSALGAGPILLGTRKLGLSLDSLLIITVTGVLPQVFAGYVGFIDNDGQAQAAVRIPKVSPLVGIRIHSAFVTLSASAPLGMKSISNTFAFTIIQ